MRYSSSVKAETVHLKSTFAYIEGDAEINTSGRGPLAGRGQSPGVVIEGISATGTGAGHGGYGGGADRLNFANGEIEF